MWYTVVNYPIMTNYSFKQMGRVTWCNIAIIQGFFLRFINIMGGPIGGWLPLAAKYRPVSHELFVAVSEKRLLYIYIYRII